jgi:hypothetical protein
MSNKLNFTFEAQKKIFFSNFQTFFKSNINYSKKIEAKNLTFKSFLSLMQFLKKILLEVSQY